MKVGVTLAVLAALLAGVGGGYAVATAGDDGAAPGPQRETTTVEPVPASPSVPVDEIAPDPDDPAIETPLELETIELVAPVPPDEPKARPLRLRVPVPVGWEQGFDGVGRYTFTDPGASDNTYVLTIEFIDAQDVGAALRRRTAELDSAAAQGNLSDLDVEINQTDDGFDSSFIDPNGYRRVGIERFYPGPDGRAFATVRGAGRERDSRGLDDLVSLITSDYEVLVP